MCGETHPEFANLYIHFLADLESLATRWMAKEELSLWERLFVEHPSNTFKWETKAERRLAVSNLNTLAASRSKFRAIGVVAHIKEVPDKRGELMSWFNLVGPRSCIGAMCFSSSWDKAREVLVPGSLVSIVLKKTDRGTLHHDIKAGKTVVYSKGEPDGRDQADIRRYQDKVSALQQVARPDRSRAGDLQEDFGDDIPF
jgi:DNA polymerase III alpha subunit